MTHNPYFHLEMDELDEAEQELVRRARAATLRLGGREGPCCPSQDGAAVRCKLRMLAVCDFRRREVMENAAQDQQGGGKGSD